MAQPIRIRAPTDPTPEEVEEHESTGHVQYRTWCGTVLPGGVLDSSIGLGTKKPGVRTGYQ